MTRIASLDRGIQEVPVTGRWALLPSRTVKGIVVRAKVRAKATM
jgi:hypothetical protein